MEEGLDVINQISSQLLNHLSALSAAYEGSDEAQNYIGTVFAAVNTANAGKSQEQLKVDTEGELKDDCTINVAQSAEEIGFALPKSDDLALPENQDQQATVDCDLEASLLNSRLDEPSEILDDGEFLGSASKTGSEFSKIEDTIHSSGGDASLIKRRGRPRKSKNGIPHARKSKNENEGTPAHSNHTSKRRTRMRREKPLEGETFPDKATGETVPVKGPPWICLLCKSEQLSQQCLIVHIKQMHGLNRKHRCRFCDKGFGRASTRNLHERQQVCLRSERRHLRKTVTKSYLCNQCGNSYSSPATLRAHTQNMHNPESNFACDLCPKKYKTMARLNEHVKSHNNQKLFMCELCSQSFRHKTYLTRHMSSGIHGGERKFACSKCDRKFFMRKHLNQHQRVHTGEKPFGCGRCSFRTAWRYDVVMHTRKLHPQFSDDPIIIKLDELSPLDTHSLRAASASSADVGPPLVLEPSTADLATPLVPDSSAANRSISKQNSSDVTLVPVLSSSSAFTSQTTNEPVTIDEVAGIQDISQPVINMSPVKYSPDLAVTDIATPQKVDVTMLQAKGPMNSVQIAPRSELMTSTASSHVVFAVANSQDEKQNSGPIATQL